MAIAAAIPVFRATSNLFKWTRFEKKTLELLSREELAFLVTDRLVSQIIVESNESSLLLGKREGYLIAKARLYYGINLAELDKNALTREDGVLVITLPEPKELDFAVDIESMKCVSKRSSLMIARDFLLNKDLEAELKGQFKQAAYDHFEGEKLIPTRSSIVKRLNDFAADFSRSVGTTIEFR